MNTFPEPTPLPRELRPLDIPYLHHLEGVTVNPVFVMGLHRSGTTVLSICMLATGHFNTTTMYHMLYRRCLLHLHFHPAEAAARRQELTDYFRSRNLVTRKYDGIAVGPDTPEEYGEALERKGRRPLLNPQNLPPFLELARKIQFTEGQDRFLLLKNPWNAQHFLYLAQAFPTARFVFIHRRPLQIIDSQIRMFASLLQEKNEYELLLVDWYGELFQQPLKLKLGQWLYSESSPYLYGKIVRHVIPTCDFINTHRQQLGSRAIDVTYDELCAQPQFTMCRVMDFLGVQPAVEPDYTQFIAPRTRSLLPRVARNQAKIDRRSQHYCQTFGV